MKPDAWKLYCEAFRALWSKADDVSSYVSPAALQEMVDRLTSSRPEALRSEMHRCLGFAFEMKGGVRTWPVWLCSMETVKEAVAKGWLSDSQLELLIPRMGMSQVVYRLTDEGGAEFMRHHYSVPSPLRQKT